ncbi:hypothetical protein A1O7_00489 [Cladophialophora yegresii CBS 114405]|uniref:CID domain-containing protein n=1 Tax=Cladophialophora yegresii CBS 114405 TaxID=1182544 RepID=W9W860_9EURO|nr:uncharacterized protein A1O7_00489 [Cladophialophora yegresii CBS 114405]EXJ64153.1 hypothetical protein A1O7_00489 [Cladophialophora yegresii CBS 114405]
MSFSDEALKAKLSTLNETQDSIVSVSQWIMFHKRHADRIANYWLTRLRDAPPPKRLNFIYLVNDIVQNARARKRSEFPDAFSPLMPEAIQTAYRSSPPEIQTKIRRVVEVWRTRNVFEVPILDAIDARMDEIDKSKGGGGKKKTLMGQSLFGSASSTGGGGLPKELESLAPLQIEVTKQTIAARPAIDAAQNEYVKLNEPGAVLPSPPVHAARLSSLIKSLAAAESSVSASIKARKALIADLERILEINKSALVKDDETYLTLDSRKASTEAKKREVEDAIIRGLTSAEASSAASTTAIGADAGNHTSPPGPGTVAGLEPDTDNSPHTASTGAFLSERPEIEQLTDDEGAYNITSTGMFDQDPSTVAAAPAAPTSATSTTPPPVARNPALAAALAEFSASSGGAGLPLGLDADYSAFLPSAGHTHTQTRPRTTSTNGLPGAKRRKTSHGAEDEQVPDLGEMGIEGLGLPGLGSQQEQSLGFPGLGGQGAQQQEQGQRQGRDVLATLDDDVDELIRQEGGM